MMIQNQPNLDQDKLNVLAQLCTQKIDDLLNKLDVEASISGNKYIGICPIHGDSDNPSTLNIYYDGYSVPGYWKCRTRCCEKKFGKNIIGFVRGRLSHLELGYHWQNKPKAIFGFNETVRYLCNFVGTSLDKIKIDPKEQERRRFMMECTNANLAFTSDGATIPREKVRKNLIIPAEYFINRGYPASILDAFDIGMAKVPKEQTKNRVIVPIYNQKQLLVGYTCRSVFDRCKKCRLFHADTSCPILESDRGLCSKWRHMNFNSEEHLYNYWGALPHIKNTNTVILVEGPGDVWRLEQNGIHNAVAMFGISLYEKQERLLANAQAMSIVVLTDNDSAGKDSCVEIKQKYGRLYRLYFPSFDGHDVGEMNADAITDNIKPLINKVTKIYHEQE